MPRCEPEPAKHRLGYHLVLSDAEGLNQWVLAGKENTLGKDHSATLTTANAMPSIFQKQRKYNDALGWYGWALAEREKVLGKNATHC